MIKKGLKIFGSIVLFVLLVVIYTNWAIHRYAEGKTSSILRKIPKNKVGLVLGTSKYQVGGGQNPYFKSRIKAAVRLYNHGKIDRILVSGDNAKRSYNEPRDFKRALIKQGIPKSDIILDYAGFRTLDSVIRAHLIFGQDSITIISQKFHNERAIFLAGHNNITAVGFNAEDPHASLKVTLREYLAKTKAYLDIIFDTQPKFLGKPIPID